MTGASPASATALPSDRRSLLSGAALASIVAATAAVPALAAEPAGPIEMAYAEWRRAAKAADAAVNATYEVEDRYREPEAPRWHPFTSEGGSRSRLVEVDGQERRRCFLDDSDENIAELRAIIDAPETVFTAEGWEPSMYPPRVAAAQRTLDAILAWQAECRRAADACGLTAAREHERPLVEAEQEACADILAITPTTLREAAFQAAVLSVGWDEEAIGRLLKRTAALAGIPAYLDDGEA